ncbi:YdhK family protein [Caldibacillus thermoamylovorans]|uniref:DUF1541 domain-containing protein n=1 Tax=Caldibacillus thermoamylovorans TaxID=35841 RepID=A0ABD4A4U2_9BACI|nr:YdhK family protein [Caldibacillus thermoamylovorans]KIO63146.1 hypothetical protein B4166_3094 [Caldibacillus thermoamylovorans]KIO71587.1 hypothetical protein B4167_3536 [Caldibacillus thermoamylovorans]
MKFFGASMLIIVLILSGCTENEGIAEENNASVYMNVSSSSEVPKYLRADETPNYPVGIQVIINANHMPEMEGATATIVGAYKTTAYKVTYIPKTVGDPVKHYKWVIHEEIGNAGIAPFEPGDHVLLHVDHAEGMDGAGATIESAKPTTVYMVNFLNTKTGSEVKNYQWVTEDELSPMKK